MEQLDKFLQTTDVSLYCERISKENKIDINVVKTIFYTEFLKMIKNDVSLLEVLLNFEYCVTLETKKEALVRN